MSTASLAPPFNPIALYEQFAQKPFQPVRVHLTDGRTYLIATREFVVVGMTYLNVGTQALGEAEGICSEIVTIPLDKIQRLEPLGVKRPPTGV